MAKLNGASALPAEAQTFLASYQALLKEMPEAEATEATIKLDLPGLLRGNGRGRRAARRSRAQSSDPVDRQRHGLQAPAGPKRPKTGRRSARQTPASGGPDICLPGRGLCRDPVFLQLMRDARWREDCAAPIQLVPLDPEDHRQGEIQSLIGDQRRRHRHRIGFSHHGQRCFVESCIARTLDDSWPRAHAPTDRARS